MSRTVYQVLYALMIVALPALTIYLVSSVVAFDGALFFVPQLELPTLPVVGALLGWWAFQLLLMVVVPGRIAQGMPQKDGTTLPYKINGLAVLGITLVVAIGLAVARVIDPAWLFLNVLPLVLTANVLVLALCIVLIVLSAPQGDAEEKARTPLEKYVLGAALNPRTGNFDWKFFIESRTSMTLWLLIDLSAAYYQYVTYGSISNTMWMVVLMQALYIIDYFVVEEAILSTWDIQHESFGFILFWGCSVWIPFTFSLQAVYLARHAFDMPIWACAAIVAFNCLGYFIFRTSNLQKNGFRRDGKNVVWGKPADFIQTKRGTKLLVSGWWGIARHANYLGDLMMGLSWCLATGFEHVVPYFYIIYFSILLVHREYRDGKHCEEKYGDDWKTYTARVPWRIVPYIY